MPRPPRQESLFGSPRRSGDNAPLLGSIERITFRSQDSDFVILRLLLDDGQQVTAKGQLPFASEGERVQLRGAWRHDPNWGDQFHFRSVEVSPPSTAEGLEKYLASELVEGIGRSFAKKLVAAFGGELLRVVQDEPERLLTVPGIGKKRQRQIIEALGKQSAKRDGLVALYGLGLSKAQAADMLKKHGEQAVGVVRRNPYGLARDVRGIGFLTADRIAEQAGIARDSPERARAGLRHFLREFSLAGDTVVPADELVARAAAELAIAAELVSAELESGCASGDFELEDFSGEPYIGLPSLLKAERAIAACLALLSQAPQRRVPEIKVEAALDWAAERLGGLTLSGDQRRAVAMALVEPVSVITGGPGVGKTTVLRALVSILEAKGVAVALAAPTGRAAKRLEEATGRPASTIHRLLEFVPGTSRFRRGDEEPIEAGFLIVDEASMLDVKLAASLVRAVAVGGSVCFVGDKDQLPSIGPGAVLRDLLESGAVAATELKEVFRQAASSALVAAAHAINRGELPDLRPRKRSEGGGTGDFFFVERPDGEQTAAMIVKLVGERIPQAYGLDPLEDIQVLTPMHRGAAGTVRLNAMLQGGLNPPGPASLERSGQRFAVGDKVLQLKNDYEKEVFNGAFGAIRAVDPEAGSLIAEFDGRMVPFKGREIDGLSLAYAASIHKSQGSEFPAVVIPILTEHFVMLKRNLLYTAMTRARRLAVIVGQRRAVEIAVSDDGMHHRRSTLGVSLQFMMAQDVFEGGDLDG